MRVSTFKREFLVKDGICKAENNISLCMVYKVITIVIISDEYHQFRAQHKFIGTKFGGKKYICSKTKDIEA